MYLHNIFTLTALAACAATADTQRARVTFNSSNTQIVGYHHSPATQTGLRPVVVIAHGLGGLQSSHLQEAAQRFAAAGYHALTFDYRTWGESAGQPRNIIDISDQQDDYRAAAGAAKNLPGADPKRLVIWGTSLSGGHVLELGVKLPELAAVIAQAPHVNGAATVSAVPPLSFPGLVAEASKDLAGSLLGAEPSYVPLANKTGEWGALTQAGALEGYNWIQPNPPPPGNVAAARFILQLPIFNPDSTAADSKVPTFIAVARDDNVTPPAESIALAQKMGATLRTYPGGHFDVYAGKPSFETNIFDQLQFLKQYVPITA